MKRFLSAFALCSLLAGCPIYGPENEHRPTQRDPVPGDRPTPGDGEPDPGSPTSCTVDTDCAIGSICESSSGRCFDVSTCVTHGDCPSESYCEVDSGECVVPDVASCGDAQACSTGFECDFRQSCRPATPGFCTTNEGCGADEQCVENRCVDTAATCEIDAHCVTGFACVERRCVALCDNGASCPSGTACDGTLCQPTTGECSDSSECSDLRTNCVEGRCLYRCTEGCHDDIEVCDDEGFCRPRTLADPEAVAPLCTTDADCNESSCVDGVCRATCDPASPDANATCEAFDGQIPICGADGYCYAR